MFRRYRSAVPLLLMGSHQFKNWTMACSARIGVAARGHDPATRFDKHQRVGAIIDHPNPMRENFGALAALLHRKHSGQGQDVDVALYEPFLTMLGLLLIDHQQLGIVPQRMGNTLPFTARNAYPTYDGQWSAVSCSAQRTAQRLLAAIGRPELIDD